MQIAVTCALVGMIVAWHRPGHPMGWILIGIADFFVLDGSGTGYATLDYRDHHGTLPFGPVAVWAGQSWAPAIVLFGLAFLVYPDGGALSEVFFLGTGVAWLSWLGYQVAAWRRSAGERRQQLKWMITGAAVCAACGIALVAWGTMPPAL